MSRHLYIAQAQNIAQKSFIRLVPDASPPCADSTELQAEMFHYFINISCLQYPGDSLIFQVKQGAYP
jgi:hypothetical protein